MIDKYKMSENEKRNFDQETGEILQEHEQYLLEKNEVVSPKQPTTYQRVPLTYQGTAFERDDKGRRILHGRGQEVPDPVSMTTQVEPGKLRTAQRLYESRLKYMRENQSYDPKAFDKELDMGIPELDEDSVFQKDAEYHDAVIGRKRSGVPAKKGKGDDAPPPTLDEKSGQQAAQIGQQAGGASSSTPVFTSPPK